MMNNYIIITFLNMTFSGFSSLIQRLNEASLRTVFLSVCPLCEKTLRLCEKHVCETCFHQFVSLPAPVCQKCQIPLPPFGHFKRCSRCRSTFYFFSRTFAVFAFDPAVQKILHRIKFQKEHVLLDFFRPWIQTLALAIGSSRYDFLIPVPLHPRRENERGFNQAHKLARLINVTLRLPYNGRHLKRVRFTSAQSTLSRSQRITTLEGHFQWKGQRLQSKRILLVDDVLTTGATVNACAKVLRENGASRVDVFVLARTLLK